MIINALLLKHVLIINVNLILPPHRWLLYFFFFIIMELPLESMTSYIQFDVFKETKFFTTSKIIFLRVVRSDLTV